MNTVITNLFSGFSETIKGMAGGLKTGFLQLFYEDPTATEKVVSELAQFGFVMVGVAMAIGIVYSLLRLIKV